jgi:hypothetical protein
MFTDNPTIPIQLETLLDVVYAMRSRRATRDVIIKLVQPRGLPDLKENSEQASNHLRAAHELGLINADADGNLRLTYRQVGQHDARLAILEAFDKVALANSDVEFWAGRFYGFLIGREEASFATDLAVAASLTSEFMDGLEGHIDRANVMNPDKFRALIRWYPYVGLGWIDPAGAFAPDPTVRLKRALPSIWQNEISLDADVFMTRLARVCPELDGGALFLEGRGGRNLGGRVCTQALATALRSLHATGTIKLHCPSDSQGWHLERAGAGVVPGESSNRFSAVELAEQRAAR